MALPIQFTDCIHFFSPPKLALLSQNSVKKWHLHTCALCSGAEGQSEEQISDCWSPLEEEEPQQQQSEENTHILTVTGFRLNNGFHMHFNPIEDK